jgi:HlyD family secretion protein
MMMNKILHIFAGRRRAIAAAVVVIAAVMFYAIWNARRSDAQDYPVTDVQRGPLTISLVESGSIQNSRNAIVKNEVPGNTTIIFLIPEGTHVKKGDLLVELDSSQLDDNRTKQQIIVMNAEAAYIRARENLEVVRNQNESSIAKAELDHRFAEQDLVKYREGEYPRELQKSESDINLAREELQRARDKFEWSERLAEEGYLTRTELQADDLAAKRAEINLALAESALQLLKHYTHQRSLDQLTSDVEQTAQALERTRIKTAADLIQAETELKTRESEYKRQQAELEKIEKLIEKCRLTAPVDGMAVYATSSAGGRWRITEPLQEGQQVRERQDLIHLPTDNAMIAEIKIQEAALRKIKVGLPVRITADALPGAMFTGQVSHIAFLPDSQSAWLNPNLKVYNTTVKIEGNAAQLRPGMSCRAEIILNRYQDALFIPLQAVTRVEGQTVVYLPSSREPEMRPVTIGLDNNRVVHILDGLQEGELVLLNPPLADSAAQDESETDTGAFPSESQNSASPAADASAPARKTGKPQQAQTESNGGQNKEATQ